MLTPKELNTPLDDGTPASSQGGHGHEGGRRYEDEPNPFGEFSSVTRDVGAW